MVQKNIIGPLFGFLTLILCFVTIATGFLNAWIAFWICLSLFILSLSIFAGLSFTEFRRFFVSRQLRYGTNMVLSLLGILGIAVFVNVIVVEKFDKRADLTDLHRNSISEQTKNILNTLDKEIKVTAYFTQQDTPLAMQTMNLLRLYQRESEFIEVSIKNPYIDPEKFQKYDLRFDRTLLFESEDRNENVTILNEQNITSALLKLIQNKTKKIYFLSDHGERDVDDLTNTGYSKLKTELENHNYAAVHLSFLSRIVIPSDCDLLVIAAPKTELKPNEIKIIEDYLMANGKLLLLLDPSISTEDVNNRLIQIMNKWGVKIGNDLVVDRIKFVFIRGHTSPIPNYEFPEITNRIRDPLALPYTRSVIPIEDTNTDLIVKTLAKTDSPIGVSWGETERKKDGTFSSNGYTPGIDNPGPVSIAVSVEESYEENLENSDGKSSTRIVVFGSSQFAMNFFFSKGSRDLFLGSVNWLTEDEDLIVIDTEGKTYRTIRVITYNEARLVRIISVFLTPLVVFISGLIVWWCRHKGSTT